MQARALQRLRIPTVARMRHLATFFGQMPYSLLSTENEACDFRETACTALPANGSLYCRSDGVLPLSHMLASVAGQSYVAPPRDELVPFLTSFECSTGECIRLPSIPKKDRTIKP